MSERSQRSHHHDLDEKEEIEKEEEEEEEELEPKTRLILIVISSALLAAALIITRTVSLPRWAQALIFAVPYLTAGWAVLKEAFESFARREFFEESTLMTVATVGAFIIGEYPEGVAVMILFQIGELLEDLASDRSRRSIEKLMEIRPDTANIVMSDGSVDEIGIGDVEPGSVIAVKPGERVPLDGVIIDGSTSLDMSALTGESLPRNAAAGDEIVSGSVNLSGVVRVRVTRPASESTSARIISLVEDAEDRKSNYQGFTERFAHIYTPVVVGCAVLLAVLPPILSGFTGWEKWIYRALEFLVVSCPCAFVISVPMTFVSGIGAAASKGIIIKGASFAERLAEVRVAVFDKTGTLTSGNFTVSSVHPAEGVSEEELLRTCAAAETYSDHPIAVSIKKAYESLGSSSPASSGAGMSEAVPGKGVITGLSGVSVICGSGSLMSDHGITAPEIPDSGAAAVHCAAKTDNGIRYLGYLLISDEIKPGAAEAISSLRSSGVTKTVILTGDREAAAKSAAEKCGADEYHAGLLPEDKVTELEKLMYSSSGGLTAFIGDGINDAPVIARADVGVAMGALGSDAAIEAADVVLMDDDPRKAAAAVRISKKTMSVVRLNVALAIILKALILILCAVGIAPMWAAVFGDVGVTMLCCLNALRAGRV